MEEKTCVNCMFFYNTVCNHYCEPSLGDDNKCFWFEDKYNLPTKDELSNQLRRRNAELEAENDRLRKVLKIAFSHECKFNDCRRMSGKVSDGYCYVHQKIYSALEAQNAKDS